ncbi:SdpI family protein [Patescibacteria group bacterium]|nr:SdpI family protein [Patescibacteria group bacterium]
MNPKISGILIFIIVLATFLTGAVAYPHVESVRLAFGLPAILLALFGLWALLPRIDPVAKGFPGFRYVYDLIWILLTALLAYGYALKLGQTLGWQVDVLHATIPGIAVLIFVAGALLTRIRRNWFFGVRTPWTLSSDEDWAKTHRFARPLFMIASVFILIGTFTPQFWSAVLLIGSILVAVVSSVVYSYLVFRRGQASGG